MSNDPTDVPSDALFGDLIYSYTRAQALADGVLIDAGAMAQEAGFRWPVALTRGAWEDCVEWTAADDERQIHQDLSGRLWDVLYMATHGMRTQAKAGDRLQFQLYRVQRDGRSTTPCLKTLQLVIGPGDDGRPVITILLPHED